MKLSLATYDPNYKNATWARGVNDLKMNGIEAEVFVISRIKTKEEITY